MNYETLYKIVRKVPKPIRNKALEFVNKRRIKKVQELKTPKRLVYFVTYRCNARCKHCFYWKDLNSGKNELTVKEIRKITESMGDIESLSLTGGEALLKSTLVEIMEEFYKNTNTRKVTLPTNGLSPDLLKETVEKMFGKMPNLEIHIQISLDGMPEFHDDFRGVEGIFDKAVESAKMLKEMQKKYPNLYTYVLTTIANSNYDEIEPLIKFVKEKVGVNHKFQLVRGASFSVFNIDKEILSGFDPKDKKVLTPKIEKLRKVEEELKELEYENELYKKIQELKLKYSIDMIENEKPVVTCLAGKLDGVLYPGGNVAMCEMTIPFANVREFDYDFEKLWNSEKAEKMRKKISKCFCTHSCNLVNSMLYDTKTLKKIADE